jgi:cytochrome b pre-mRNA-processing protein 3
LSFLSSIFGAKQERGQLAPLYRSAVAAARAPLWYRDGEVPDTVDGRFDMLAAILALVLLRLDAEGDRARRESVWLTECFIDDMEGSVREFGTGDLMVGKRVGQLVGALGGRLSAFRDAIDQGGGFEAAVIRNIFHEAPPSPAAPRFVAERLERFQAALPAIGLDGLLAGKLPSP